MLLMYPALQKATSIVSSSNLTFKATGSADVAIKLELPLTDDLETQFNKPLPAYANHSARISYALRGKEHVIKTNTDFFKLAMESCIPSNGLYKTSTTESSIDKTFTLLKKICKSYDEKNI
jgi:hypothetical protein